MSLDDLTIKRKELLQNTLLFELDQYRYLPLYLALLYVSITPAHASFSFSDLKLTTRTTKDEPESFAINIIHQSKKYPSIWADKIVDLTILKLKHPYTGGLHLFKTPLYPCDALTDESPDDEKAIIFARNKKIKRLINSLIEIDSANNSWDGALSFPLVIPYLVLNKDKKLIVTNSDGSSEPMELQYDAQNVSIKVKDLMSGSKYATNPTQSKFLVWVENYLVSQHLHRKNTVEGSSFYRFYLPERFEVFCV